GFSNSAPLGQIYIFRSGGTMSTPRALLSDDRFFALSLSQLSHFFYLSCPGQKNLRIFLFSFASNSVIFLIFGPPNPGQKNEDDDFFGIPLTNTWNMSTLLLRFK